MFLSRYLIFRTGTSLVTPTSRDGFSFRQLTEEDLLSRTLPDDVRQRQSGRYERFGDLCCYGAFRERELCAFAWLLRKQHRKYDSPLVFTTPIDAAEITAAETLPAHRRQGLYPYVIQNLCSIALSEDVSEVYLKTGPTNAAALKSFYRAGLYFCGTVIFWNAFTSRVKPSFIFSSFLPFEVHRDLLKKFSKISNALSGGWSHEH